MRSILMISFLVILCMVGLYTMNQKDHAKSVVSMEEIIPPTIALATSQASAPVVPATPAGEPLIVTAPTVQITGSRKIKKHRDHCSYPHSLIIGTIEQKPSPEFLQFLHDQVNSSITVTCR